VVSKDTWETSSDSSIDIKPKSKGIFKSSKIGRNVKSILKIENQYKESKKLYEEKLVEFIKFKQNK
jgi:hypothetical protein